VYVIMRVLTTPDGMSSLIFTLLALLAA
jgi:hypothetical protein